jgi:hypothetical protein
MTSSSSSTRAVPWRDRSSPTLLLAAVLALATGLPAALPAQDGPVTLELKPQEGATERYRFQTTTRVAPPPQLAASMEVATTLTMSRTAEWMGPDTIRYRSIIESLEVEPRVDNAQVRSQIEQMAEQSQQDLVGREFLLVATRSGEVVEMDLGEGNTMSGNQLQQSLRQMSFTGLPQGPVAVGDTWTDEQAMDASTFGSPVPGEIVYRTTSTLESLTRRDGRLIANLRVDGDFEFRPAGGGQGGMMDVEANGTSRQDVQFDVDAGRYISSTGDQDITLEMSAPGSGGAEAGMGSMSVNVSVSHSGQLVGS